MTNSFINKVCSIRVYSFLRSWKYLSLLKLAITFCNICWQSIVFPQTHGFFHFTAAKTIPADYVTFSCIILFGCAAACCFIASPFENWIQSSIRRHTLHKGTHFTSYLIDGATPVYKRYLYFCSLILLNCTLHYVILKTKKNNNKIAILQ